MKRIRKITIPDRNKPKLNFSGDTTDPRTRIAITNLPTSNSAFANSLRWFLSSSNLTGKIIQQIKTFVNSVRSNPARRDADAQLYRTSNGVKYFGMKKVACPLFRSSPFVPLPSEGEGRVRGLRKSVFFSAVISVCLLLINLPTYQPINCLYAQEIDVKTKIKELKHKDPKVRITAIQSLGKVQNEDIVRALTDAYKKEKDAYLRMQIVDSLSVNQSTSALAGVISALDDPNPQVRQTAVIALGYYGDNEKIVNALSTLFDNEKEEAVKFSIVNTLGQQKNKTAVSGLGKALDKKNDKRMRLFAVTNLGKIQTKEAFTELEKNKDDSDPEVKEKVKKVLEKKK